MILQINSKLYNHIIRNNEFVPDHKLHDTILLTGHSLGGAVMEELIRFGKGIGFNSGSSPAYNSFRSKPKNIDTYLIDGDFVSVFNKSPKGVFKGKGNYSPHDIENFI